MELLGKDLDKLSEVNTTVGNIVEDSLNLVGLILHIANLHIQPHLGSNLSRANHRVVFKGYRLLPLLNIVRTRLAVYLLELAILRIEAESAHLTRHHIARKRDDTHIVSRLSLNRNNIAHFKLQVVHILIEGAACILETNLKYIGREVVGVLFKPSLLVQFHRTADTLGARLPKLVFAKGATATNNGFIVFCVVHNCLTYNIYIGQRYN